MSINKAKFSIENVIKHRHYDFRGVINDVDYECNNCEVVVDINCMNH